VFKIIKKKESYYFCKNGIIISTPNSNLLFTKKKSHANLILRELEQNNLEDLSILGLTYFSCNLTKDERRIMEEKIVELLDYDNVFYRCNNTVPLNRFLDKNLNKFVFVFGNKFKMKLVLLDSILKKQSGVSKKYFINYLKGLDIFFISIFYKISLLISSTILTYFFIEKEISQKTLCKLSNLETNFQQKTWGIVEEQKRIDEEYNNILNKLSIFLQIIA